MTLIRRQRGVDPTGSVPGQRSITLRPGQSRTATVAPVNGRGFSLRWQSDSVLDIGDDFHTWRRPADCDGGGRLPTTGSAAANTAILGGSLVLAGLPAVWFFRRRRPTTPA
ncbi:MAG TPA: LPXTG cell wall anchor domain-containing protein [Pilimelia sp.]|nr:LPXTG cell wall anchor domain-containing protein [Pilimelia sp.]